MFEQTLTLLLAGEFICEVRYPEAWRFLRDEAHRADAEAFLARLGRRLARTRQHGAWFAAYLEIGTDERRAIRDGFADIKHNLRFLRTEDLDGYVDGFNNAVFDLADHIDGALQYLRMLADTRFASVHTLAEKQRQNTWYIGRAERIGEAIKAVQIGGLMDRIEEEPAVAPLMAAFRAQLWERLPEWRDTQSEGAREPPSSSMRKTRRASARSFAPRGSIRARARALGTESAEPRPCTRGRTKNSHPPRSSATG